MNHEVTSPHHSDGLLNRLEFYLEDVRIERQTGQEVSVTGVIRDDFPGFQGHFPGKPILAGAFQLEMLGIVAGGLQDEPSGIVHVKMARFRKMLGPGDVLRLNARREENGEQGITIRADITQDGARACQATFVLGGPDHQRTDRPCDTPTT